ncbi:MAG TPA: hypothetical protein VFZ80_00205 [Acidimicrobiia bacterium]
MATTGHASPNADTVAFTAQSEPTVLSYFEAFSSRPSWRELARWPPDVFALTNLILDHTEAYRFTVAPPRGARWPPRGDWNERVQRAADEWRVTAANPQRSPPSDVVKLWRVVLERRDTPLSVLRRGEDCPLLRALLTLHAIADEACRGLASSQPAPAASFERAAWDLLSARGSLAHIEPTRVRITPKTQLASRGITIRSLSRYLALNYESIDVHWRRIDPLPDRPERTKRDYNILLVPWPLQVTDSAFRPVEGPLENMDPGTFGFFQYDPDESLDVRLLRTLVEQAQQRVKRIDTVITPEASIRAEEIPALEMLMTELGVLSVIAGVRQSPRRGKLGRNYVHLGVRTGEGWTTFEQEKHHRWCLDQTQIRQYHLSHALDPSRQWWEAIDLPARTVEIIDLGGGATVAPLVCEDLARMDEVSDLLRRIGPTLVVALLLDGPQLPQRWPCRYAAVLADEPGSAVLTLSAFGMVARSRPSGKPRSRVVAMWSDPMSGPQHIELGRGASGILLTASAEAKTVWTADGRRHDTTPSLTLRNVEQMRVKRSPSQRRQVA